VNHSGSNNPYYQKGKTDLAVDHFAGLENPTIADLNLVGVTAQVEQGIDEYRIGALSLVQSELESETHLSKRLNEHLALSGDEKPHSKCHAHAIVSGSHKDAARIRAILAWLKVRIDDPDNGCWLPENTAALKEMPVRLRNAVPHSRIHRYNYYFWLNQIINTRKTKAPNELREVLNMVELRLQSGAQPIYVMNKKGVGLPA
jgi:hypothetical protein